MGEWIDGWVGEKMGEQADERIDGYIYLVENAHHHKAMEVEKNFRFQVGGIDHWARGLHRQGGDRIRYTGKKPRISLS